MNLTCSPIPEALDGNKWDVKNGSGSCDTVSRVMRVPLGSSDADRFIRNHEMAHAKITPRQSPKKQCEKYGVSIDAMQVCEDLRVHHYLEHAHIDRCGSFTQVEMDELVKRKLDNDRTLAMTLVACRNTADWDRAVESMTLQVEPSRLQPILDKVIAIDHTLQRGRGIGRPIGFKNCTISAAKLFDIFFPETGPADVHVPMGALMREAYRRRGNAQWGDMEIENLPATLSRRIPSVSRTKTYRDEGTNLSAVYRLPIDGRIFSRHRAHKGGTVLIDGSGSMQLTSEELLRIVTTAPAATIAIYSGRSKSGKLTIIGRKGMVATEAGLASARRSGSGNIVDGPALKWLSKQSAPRFWVSDGLVTGKHDASSITLAIECQNVCHRSGIKRVEKSDAVCDLLKSWNSR